MHDFDLPLMAMASTGFISEIFYLALALALAAKQNIRLTDELTRSSTSSMNR